MAGWWFMETGMRRWNWSKEPTFKCHNAETWKHDEGIVRRERQIAAAAAELGADPVLLAALLTQRHRSGGGIREKVEGRYTGRCRICGARLLKLGFRAWVDEAIAPAKMTDSERSRAEISTRLGGAPPRRPVGEGRYFDTKKQAEQWARDQAKQAKGHR